jgi:nitroimidazol reductase NimA-like FMN-containing flavoprotein (pyridoxamine 5'-phosphate oxidase superfamily)
MERMDRSQIPAWECYELLASEHLGRVTVVDHEYPLALPMNYQLVGEGNERRIVLRTSPESTIGRYEGRASLEIDHIDPDGRAAWSVIARGHLHRLVGEQVTASPHPWLLAGRDQWMAIDIVAVSGRRFVGRRRDAESHVEWTFEG